MVVDGVEAQLAFDHVVRSAHDAAAVGRDQQLGLFGHHRAVVEHRELHVELGVGADAGDFRSADAAREHQRAGGGTAAIAVQDGVRGDDVRHAIDLHQAQRAFLVEHGAHDRREPVDLRDHRVARRMVIAGIVGVVLERGHQLLFRIEQPDQVDVHLVEAGFGEVLVLEFGSSVDTYEYMSSQRAKSRETVSISVFLVTSALRMTSMLRETSFCSMFSNLRRMR